MTKQQIYNFFSDGGNKKFYLDWFCKVCAEITIVTKKELTESQMGRILEGYFKQVKEGGN